MDHNTGLKVSPNQTQNALIRYPLSDPAHQDVVVYAVEECHHTLPVSRQFRQK
jgi:hypothetical protein